MKNIVFLAVILISSYGSALAQAEKPEFFAGYSYENLDTGVKSSDFTSTATSLDNRFNLNGVHLSVADYSTQ